MKLVNPFEEIVLFGKTLPLEPTSSTRIGALVPTGKHVSHANRLVRVRGKASGGPATKLVQLHKGLLGSSKGAKRGLQQIADLPKVNKVPTGGRQSPRVAEAVADSKAKGRWLARPENNFHDGPQNVERELHPYREGQKSVHALIGKSDETGSNGVGQKNMVGQLRRAVNSNIPNAARNGKRL